MIIIKWLSHTIWLYKITSKNIYDIFNQGGLNKNLYRTSFLDIIDFLGIVK